MILWYKTPETAVGRVVAVVTHHPIVVHCKCITVGWYAVDNNLIINNIELVPLVLLDNSAVERQIFGGKVNCRTLLRNIERTKVVLRSEEHTSELQSLG